MITENDLSLPTELAACRASLEQYLNDAPLLAADGRRIARQAAEFTMGYLANRIAIITRHNRELTECVKVVLDECVENAGSDDPQTHPPSFNLLSKLNGVLHSLPKP